MCKSVIVRAVPLIAHENNLPLLYAPQKRHVIEKHYVIDVSRLAATLVWQLCMQMEPHTHKQDHCFSSALSDHSQT